MSRYRLALLPFALAAIVGPGTLSIRPATAQTDSSAVQLYALGPKSDFETGCFGACLCPVWIRPLSGTFLLKFVGFDGLFNNYSVSDVRWVASQDVANIPIRGGGTYRVGGEVAIQEQLSLDLSVGGGAPQHFDSGLISGGGGFPKIDVVVSIHGRMACVDTVMRVEAAPDPPSSAGGDAGVAANHLESAVPNPFGQRTEFRLDLARSGEVDVAIFDVHGRVVRHLASGAWLSTGSRTLSWDGRRDDGASCAAGVYFVRANVAGSTLSRPIVKVE